MSGKDWTDFVHELYAAFDCAPMLEFGDVRRLAADYMKHSELGLDIVSYRDNVVGGETNIRRYLDGLASGGGR